MLTIFAACQDKIGLCIRQYIVFGLSILGFILSAYSLYRISRIQRKISIQHLPFVVNCVTSLMLIAIYMQQQHYNTRIVLLMIEAYTFFLLTFICVFSVMKNNNQRDYITILTRFFLAVTGLIVSGIIAVMVLSVTDVLNCSSDQGLPGLIIVLFQIALMGVNFVYSRKQKNMIEQTSFHVEGSPSQNEHILDQQNKQNMLKIKQIRMIRAVFLLSILLHITQLLIVQIGDAQITCKNSDKFEIDGVLDLVVLSIQNLSQLFPHFMIPFILWYLPATMNQTADTLFLKSSLTNDTPKKLITQESGLVVDFVNQNTLRERLKGNASPLSKGKTIQQK